MRWPWSTPTPSSAVAGLTKDQQHAAIRRATRDELLAFWGVWLGKGHSLEGLLYAAVLERLLELGVTLTPTDQARLDRARAQRAAMHPPINGRTR